MTRPRRRPFDPSAKVHDRRALEVGRQSQVAPIVVDDPYQAGDKIAVMRNLRDDPLARLHSRKSIDESQYQAGRAFQADWEAASRGPRAIDPGKEAVDGGLPPDPLPDSQAKAVDSLKRVYKALGPGDAAVVSDLLIHRLTCSQVALSRGLSGERWQKFFGMSLQVCLHKLAHVYGFATEKTGKQRI